MKASELIEKLQEQIELHGDCDVYLNYEVELEGWNGDYTLDLDDYIRFVDFDNKEKSIRLSTT